MRLSIWVALIFVLPFGQIWAQEKIRNQFSSVPDSSRYELVQSEIAVKVILKIDKYSGRVFQLVQGSKGLTWQLIKAEQHSQDRAIPDQVNYQVLTSGLAVRMTYLINVNTGATWQLVEDSEFGVFWNALY